MLISPISFHPIHLTLSDLISSELKQPSLPWLQPITALSVRVKRAKCTLLYKTWPLIATVTQDVSLVEARVGYGIPTDGQTDRQKDNRQSRGLIWEGLVY